MMDVITSSNCELAPVWRILNIVAHQNTLAKRIVISNYIGRFETAEVVIFFFWIWNEAHET